MNIDSIALETDIFFWRATGTVVDRGDYLLVSTPASPGWYGGNLLIFDHPPHAGDFERWNALFRNEFGDNPRIEHVLFNWNTRPGDEPIMQPFLDAGFEFESEVALTATMAVRPEHVNADVVVRRIESEADWEAVLEVQIRCRPDRFEAESYAGFRRMRQRHYRNLVDAGHGHWYGAFLGERAVGGLGLFHVGDVGRFQEVEVDPEFRRRGICARLVYDVSRAALEDDRLHTLVMVADENYHAARIYERAGFKASVWGGALWLYPEREREG